MSRRWQDARASREPQATKSAFLYKITADRRGDSSDDSSACVSRAAGRAFGRARLLPGLGVFPGDGSDESLSARALPRAIAAWSFCDAASIAALASKCSSSAPDGATFADDRRLATRFQDIVTLWQRKYRLCSTINPSGESSAVYA